MKRSTPLSLKHPVKGLVLIAALFALLTWLAAVPVAQAAPGDTVRGTVIAEMPLYAQPDAGSEVVGSLPVGSTIQGKEEADGWYVASMGEQNVYFSGEYFARYTAVDGTVIKAAVVGGPLEVLYAPAEGAAPCGTLENGATIQFCVFNDDYFMARFVDGTICYIPSWRVNLYDPAEGGTLIRWAGPDGTDVYEAPSVDSAILLSFEPGRKLAFADFNAEWLMAKANVGGEVRTVFVPKSQVVFEDPSTTEPPAPVDPVQTEWVITRYGVQSYAEPSEAASETDYFRKGAVLTGAVGADGWCRVLYNGSTMYLPAGSYALIPASNYSVYERPYGVSLADAVRYQWNSATDQSTWILGNRNAATYADLAYYMDPANFPAGTSGFFQFLVLNAPLGVDVGTLNEQLAGRGMLAGQGQAFSDAAYRYNVNEAYLISHAIHETGNGTSDLAQGVWYDPEFDNGPDAPKGKAYTTEQPNTTRVYNMYGIGAVDSDPLNGGARYAYNRGWTTPYAAVYGGAEFIGRTYFASDAELGYGYPSTLSGQNTLYKMLYHPEWVETRFEKPWHEYATDVAWANSQTYYLTQLLADYTTYSLLFEVPAYVG